MAREFIDSAMNLLTDFKRLPRNAADRGFLPVWEVSSPKANCDTNINRKEDNLQR